MNPNYFEYDFYNNSSIHFDDQICIFEKENLLVAIVADGVSMCTSGRVASLFLSYYIKEFFLKNYATQKFENVKEFTQKSVEYAHKYLIDFSKSLNSTINNNFSSASIIDFFDGMLSNFRKHSDQNKIYELLNQISNFTNNKMELLKNINPNPFSQFEKMYNEINPNENNITDRIKKLIDNQKDSQIEFSTTLSITIFDTSTENEIQFLTYNLGDSSVLLINNDFSFLSHYYISDGKQLSSCISNYENGIIGKIDIANRILTFGDLLLVGSDGAKINYGPRGYAYAPINNLLNQYLKNNHTIKGFPKHWFDYLINENQINDDFSFFIFRIKSMSEDKKPLT